MYEFDAIVDKSTMFRKLNANPSITKILLREAEKEFSYEVIVYEKGNYYKFIIYHFWIFRFNKLYARKFTPPSV